MENKAIELGDVVTLKSGSERLTVAKVTADKALCYRMDYSGLSVEHAWLPVVILKVVSSNSH